MLYAVCCMWVLGRAAAAHDPHPVADLVSISIVIINSNTPKRNDNNNNNNNTNNNNNDPHPVADLAGRGASAHDHTIACYNIYIERERDIYR